METVRIAFLKRQMHIIEETHEEGERIYPGVQFTLSGGAKWSRVIDYQGRQKAYFHGGYKGQVWVPPQLEIFGDILLMEGVFEAMSWVECGHKAVALLSSTHIPDAWLEAHRHQNVNWIIALNHDPAGIKGGKKLKQWMLENIGQKAKLAFPPEGQDWNDLLHRGALHHETLLSESLFLGELLGARSEVDYYQIWQERFEGKHLFEFDNQVWQGIPPAKDKSLEMRPIANFTMYLRYSQCDESNPESPCLSYIFECKTHKGATQKVRSNADELSTSSLFKTSTLKRFAGIWSGEQPQLDQIVRKESMKNHPTVRLVQTNGYDAKSDLETLFGATNTSTMSAQIAAA